MNTFGETLRLTTFGESHGPAIGGVIDGFPSRFEIDFDFIARRMAERRPGRPGVSQRREEDNPEFLSGISPEGVTLGSPIAFLIRNGDARSGDYESLRHAFRPSHADFTWQAKYGIRDHRGGGRASARETACRVVAGALAEQFLLKRGVSILARLERVGEATGDEEELMAEVERIRREGDSAAGLVSCEILGLPPGVGEPVYDKLNARLAYAMMSINAARGIEFGAGFDFLKMKGSQAMDVFYRADDGRILTRTNHSGGIQGGISNGMPVAFRVVFKPTPTIGQEVPLMTEEGKTVIGAVPGRHDPCVAVRAVPVVRAMAALTVADLLLRHPAS